MPGTVLQPQHLCGVEAEEHDPGGPPELYQEPFISWL